MTTVRAPQTLRAATALCERFAKLEGEIGAIEAARNAVIADANAVADGLSRELVNERDAIREKLAPWWNANAAKLTEGKRKSIELGGCQIGSVAGRASLDVSGKDKVVALKLRLTRWGKALTKVAVSLDKAAILKALTGSHGDKLKEMGFSEKAGEESFVLKRVEQSGTLASSSS